MEQGIYVNRRLRSLRRIFAEWIRLNNLFGRRWTRQSRDCPWWYNERALLSLFAGALWRTNNEAFEEFSEYKRTEAKLSAGRIDLWFLAGRHEYWAEAKACEIAITRNGKQRQRISAAMAAAKRDALRLKPDGSTKRLAVTFIAPYLTRGHEQIFQERLTWLIDMVRGMNPSAMAWTFPKLRKSPRHKRWISPGIIIFIKQVHR